MIACLIRHAPFEIVKESPALALVDAHNGAGTVVAVKAMRLAIEKAKECGVGMIMVRHWTHFGSASFSASQALPAGCIGVSMTNAGPEMAPWGGIDARRWAPTPGPWPSPPATDRTICPSSWTWPSPWPARA